MYAGQALGTLSQPPAMPDTVAMLAERLSETKLAEANLNAKRTYVAERTRELEALRVNTERSLSETQTLLGTNTTSSGTFSKISAKKEGVRAILRSTFAKMYPVLSGSATFPEKWNAITLISPIGAQNSRLRDQFQGVIFTVKNDLDDQNVVPISSGLAITIS